ncbi:MAG: siphovirus Gp157 family protein [Deltaproteobacteria bacterium]|nr:siphovirus Gp157 family protein [Deltaproteobacteria bacterium]
MNEFAFDEPLEDIFSAPPPSAARPDPPAPIVMPAPSVQPKAPAARVDFEAMLETAKAELAPYERAIEDFAAQATALEVKSPESEAAAMNIGLPLDKIYKAIEKRRKELVDAPNAYVKGINSVAKYFQDKIDRGRQTVKDKLAVYAKAKALEAQRAAETERRARAEMQAKLDAEAARLTAEAQAQDAAAPPVEAPKLPEAPPADPPKTVRSEEGTATEVKTWAFKVTDPAAVPREYLAVDEKAIRKAVKDGIREIPGVEIFEKTNIRFGG